MLAFFCLCQLRFVTDSYIFFAVRLIQDNANEIQEMEQRYQDLHKELKDKEEEVKVTAS